MGWDLATGDVPRRVAGGRFELLETIGTGGMGIVYRAFDRERGVQVALKTLRGVTPDRVLRFKTEFRALRDLRHPNLVELGELFETEGTWFFTMELVAGVPFLDWVTGTGDEPRTPTSEPSGRTAPAESEPSARPDRSAVGSTSEPGARPDRSAVGSTSEPSVRPDQSHVGSPSEPSGRAAPAESEPSVRPDWSAVGSTSEPGTAVGSTSEPGATTGATAVAELDTVVLARPSPARRERRDSGRELIERLPRPRCDDARLRRALTGLARGLAALHRAGKVHRDVKPSNILVDAAGRAVVLDFGVVAELSHAGELERDLLIGTVKYMAPEQARGELVGPQADWYAVGVLVFQALTGRFPLAASSQADLIAQKQQLDAPSPRELSDGIPDDLARLCEGLLRRDPEGRMREPEILELLAAGHGEAAGVAPPVIEGQLFVGRLGELAALEAAFADSRRGAVCVAIEGESGVGKTALVGHFLELARAVKPRTVVLRGRCHERERIPYNAFDGVVDDLARFLLGRAKRSAERFVPRHTGELLEVFPALRAVPAFAAAASPARASDLRGRGFAALRELLARIGEARPIVIAIDDLQWADADSAALLDELLADRATPLCFLATLRPCEGAELAGRLAAVATDLRPIALAGLDRGDAEALVRLLTGGDASDGDASDGLASDGPASGDTSDGLASGPTDGRSTGLASGPTDGRSTASARAATASQLVAESRGHPLFLRELVRHGAGVAGRPVLLDEAIWSRASRLDDATRRLLIVVAVAGSPIPRRAALAAAGLGPADADASIAALTRDHLVRITVPGPRSQDHVEPFHDRVRAAVYASQPAEVLRDTHRALSRALEATGASPDALLGHFHAAGDHERAAHYLIAAAEAALRAFAFGRAGELYRRALEAPDVATDLAPARRAALLVGLAEAYANDGRTAEAGECFLEAAALEPADSDRQLDLLRRAAERFLMAGRLERGLDTTRAVLARAGMAFPGTRPGTVAGILWNQLRTRAARLHWTRRAAADPPALDVDICLSIGAGLSMVDTLLGAYFSSRAAVLALDRGNPLQIARAMSTATVGAAVLGRRERAAALLDAARRAAAEDGTWISGWYADLARTVTVFALDNDFHGSLASARALEDRWYAGGRGPGWETDVAMHFTLASLQLLGDFAELARRVGALVHGASRTGDLFQEVTLRVRFAVRHLLADRPDTADADIAGALASWQPSAERFGNQRAWALWSRTRVALYAGRLDTLERELGAEWQRMRRSFVGRVPVMRVEWYHVYGTYLLGRALAARSRGRASEHAELCREAAAVADRLARLEFPASRVSATLLRAGVAWAHDGDRIAATRDALDAALAGAMTAYVPQLRRRLGEAIGGDDGVRMIAEADAEARHAGFTNPARAAEMAIPTGSA